MADSPVDHGAVRALTCLRTAWSGKAGWLAVLGMLPATWLGMWFVTDELASMQPVDTHIARVYVINEPLGSVQRALAVELTSPPANNCTRLSQQLLFRMEGTKPTYYPLGSALNGEGFGASATQSFTVKVSIPPATPDGEYWFVHRSVYTCTWFGGFILRRIPFEAPRVRVTIGEVAHQ